MSTTELAVVDQSPAELVPTTNVGLIVRPAASVADILEVNRAYHELYSQLLDANDFQPIGPKKFPKKSAWRKLSLAFNVTTKITTRDYERNDSGRIVRAEIIATATAPNGREADGLGACDIFERCCEQGCTKRHTHCQPDCNGGRHFSNPQHDIPATAATRATNRAASDLFGMGEVSAEEVNTYRLVEEPVAEPGWDVGELLKPWLQEVYKVDGAREELRTWTAGNGYPDRAKDFNQAQATALLVHIGTILGARQQASTAAGGPSPAPAAVGDVPTPAGSQNRAGDEAGAGPVARDGGSPAAVAATPARDLMAPLEASLAAAKGAQEAAKGAQEEAAPLAATSGSTQSAQAAGSEAVTRLGDEIVAQMDGMEGPEVPHGSVSFEFARRSLAGHATTRGNPLAQTQAGSFEVADLALRRLPVGPVSREEMDKLRKAVEPLKEGDPDPLETASALVEKAKGLEDKSRRTRPAPRQMGLVEN